MKSTKNYRLYTTGAALALLAGTAALCLPAGAAQVEDITVYKSPTCGCCNKWIGYLENNGFHVTAHDLNDLTEVKAWNGVRPQYASCHTAVVDGYAVEGHVPADSIRRLLAERPKGVTGIAVPDMPIGSPGMEQGERTDHYNVLTFDAQGNTRIYERR